MSRWLRYAILALLGVPIVWSLVLFAPTSLGGHTSYELTHGVSMLPTIQPGSAVVVRAESSYQIGEIAAYYNPQLHTVVLHRIIARRAGRFVFKGDNNQFPDLYEPRHLLGAKVFYSHGLGNAVLNLRRPLVGAVILGLLASWCLWPSRSTPQHATALADAITGKPADGRPNDADDDRGEDAVTLLTDR